MKPRTPRRLSLVIPALLWATSASLSHAAGVPMGPGDSFSFGATSGTAPLTPVMFNEASSTLVFSTSEDFDGFNPDLLGGGVGLFNLVKAGFQAGSPAFVTERLTGGTSIEEEVFRSGIEVSSPVHQVSIDANSGEFQRLSLDGSFTINLAPLKGVATGGSVTLSDVRIDLFSRQVYANVSGQRLMSPTSTPVTVSERDVAIWNFDSLSGVGALPLSAMYTADPKTTLETAGFSVEAKTILTTDVLGNQPGYQSGYGYGCSGQSYNQGACHGQGQPIYRQEFAFEVVGETRLEGLSLTQRGLNAFSSSLGLNNLAISAFVGTEDFGSFNVKTSFTLTVPEPQTYALMALGFAMMTVAVRRNRSNPQGIGQI